MMMPRYAGEASSGEAGRSAQFLPDRVQKAVEAVPDVSEVKVDVVWDPRWPRDRMSDAAKLELGMF